MEVSIPWIAKEYPLHHKVTASGCDKISFWYLSVYTLASFTSPSSIRKETGVRILKFLLKSSFQSRLLFPKLAQVIFLYVKQTLPLLAIALDQLDNEPVCPLRHIGRPISTMALPSPIPMLMPECPPAPFAYLYRNSLPELFPFGSFCNANHLHRTPSSSESKIDESFSLQRWKH